MSRWCLLSARSLGRSNWVITWRLYDSCIHQVDINFPNHLEPSSNINRNTCGSTTCVFDVSVPPKRNNWNRVNPTTGLRDSLAKWSKSELSWAYFFARLPNIMLISDMIIWYPYPWHSRLAWLTQASIWIAKWSGGYGARARALNEWPANLWDSPRSEFIKSYF